MFTSGGTLWLGHWHITKEHITGVPLQPFFGVIDEVRIWSFSLDTLLIRQSFRLVITANLPSLSALWLFDEGVGRVIANFISSSPNMYLPEVISRRPTWQFSYVREVFPSMVVSASVQFSVSFGLLAKKRCLELIYHHHLQAQCGKLLSASVTQFYFKACLFDVQSSSSLDTAYIALIAYADYCMTVLHLSSWPAQRLCKQLPQSLPRGWIGPDCSVKCVFGSADKNNASLCVCHRGYWGEDCANECPGGGNKPCNDHGNCNVRTGSCECDLNWRGNGDCSNCTPGWTGSDCAIAVAVTQLPTCSAFLGGHFTNFDGAHFNFFGVGEFWFVRSIHLSGQLRQIPCYNGESRCINAVAFSFLSGWKVVVHAPYEESKQPVVWVNGREAVYSSTRIQISSDVFLEKTSSTTYLLSSVLEGFKFQLRVVGRGLVIAGHVNQSFCNGTNVLCGNCDGNRDNDFNVTAGSSLEEIWRVSMEESLFIYHDTGYKEERAVTGAEYALMFNGVGVCSDLMPDVLNASSITMELLFKMYSEPKVGGVLLTYSKAISLTLFIEGTLKVRIGIEIWDTGLSPQVDSWNQVTLVYYNTTGAVYIYHINSIGVVRLATRTMTAGIINRGSIISIGQWIPSLEINTKESDSLPGFVGVIDEVRFWNREFSLQDVTTSWRVNVLSNARYLVILWKFNEGQSGVIHDLISRVHLYIPSIREAPRWVFSYADIKVLPVTPEITFSTSKVRVEAESWCHTHIQNSPLGIACGGLGGGTVAFYVRACLRVIASGKQVSLGISVVVAFADTCEIQANLTIWPARQMCTYEIFRNSRLMNWIGLDCNIPCPYGYQPLGLYGSCQCDSGFWGQTCNGVCPGGLVNVCSGHGNCIDSNGICKCKRRWQGALDCSQCTPGFFGKDCSVAVAPPITELPVTSVFGTGYIVTLDGIKINVNVAGEFRVLALSRYGLSIQFRQVRIGSYVRVRCVIVVVQQDVLAIHSSVGVAGQVLVTLNGLPISKNSLVSLGVSGFEFRRTSLNTYVMVGPEGFNFVINSLAIHFDVSITMNKDLCQETCGLLGRCHISGSRVPPSNCTAGGILDTQEVSNITQELLISYVNSWAVPQNESSFGPILNISGEPQLSSVAGSCLYFNGTSVISAPLLNTFVGNYITIQFFVKAKNPDVYTGTIISYALNETFAIAVNKTIHIYFGTTVIDTQLVLERELWNHISFVYMRSSGQVQFYLVNSIGIIQSKVFLVGVGIFADGGTLALALWQVTKVSLSLPGFVGWIDELSFWNKRFDSVTILQTWNSNLQSGTPGIALLWKFNEGSGFICRATVGSLNFGLPTPPWKSPLWYPSDAIKEANVFITSDLSEKEPDKSTQDLCSDVFLKGPLLNECANVTGGSKFYYEACISEVSTSGTPESALMIATNFAKECQAALNLSSLPGKGLCNVIPGGRYNDWVGVNCTTKCEVGWFTDGDCKCDNGYWGINCSRECPGGAANPCYGNGKCDIRSGKCNCHPNWDESENCFKCAPGWIGKSCSVAVSTTQSSVTGQTSKVCTILERGYVTGFDGSLFTFTTLGEFIMINSSILQAQVRQVPCEKSSVCLNAIGVRFNDLTISVHAAYESDSFPVVYVNEELTKVGGEPSKDMLKNNISIQPIYRSAYRIVVSHYLSIQTVFSDRYMSVESTVTSNFCQLVDGLCGSCAKLRVGQNATQGSGGSVTSINRPTTVLEELGKPNATSDNVNEFVTKVFPVQDPIIVIDAEMHKETRVVYGGLYSLYYRFTAVVTQTVVKLFVSQTLTFQLLVKSCNPQICGGTVISYTSNVTFYISNHVTVRVVIGLDVFDTGIATEADVWNQITLVFVREKLQLFVFVTFSSGLVQVRKFSFTIDPFISAGTFAIGMWQPASGSISVQPTNVFLGQIDEVSVWERPFDYALVEQSWRSNIQLGAPSLTNLWKFNEGKNSIVKDLVADVALLFPRYPLGKPEWVFSDAPITSVVTVNPNEDNATLHTIAIKVCFEFIYEGPIHSACNALGNVTLEFYLRACVQAVVDTGLTVESIDVVITIADYCQKIFGLPYWPAQSLCNKFPGKRFPNWMGKNCTIPCIFGQAANESEVCVCDPGFYGTNCSGICPGGKGNACNNHGVCDVVTGKCSCELNWQGNENCSTCARGWAGTDCSIAVTQWPSGSVIIGIGAVSLGGQFTSLSGVSYSLQVTGEYYLIYSIHLSVNVQIRLVSCTQQESCINSIALQIASYKVVLHGPYSSGGSLIVWLNGKVIDIDLHPITLDVYGFTVSKITAHLWEVKYAGLYLKIRVTGRFLSVGVEASGLVCKSSIGLLGSCNQGLLQSLLSYYPTKNCSEEGFMFNVSGNHSNVFRQGSDILREKNASDTKAKTQDIISTLITTKLKVKKCHSLFEYKYKEIVEYREANAGYALYFDHTTVVTDVIHKAFSFTDITVKIMFKTVRYGVIISYTMRKTFFVTNTGGKFTIFYGENVYHTNIVAERNKWNQVSLVFRKSTTVLQFYYFSSGGQLHRLDINVGFDIFTPGGTIALAGWMPSLDGSGIQPTDFFAGFIDEVRIWTRYFHPAFILQTWNRSVSVNAQDLAHAWKFNEGEGIAAVDKVTGMKLVLPFKPWRKPEWRYSDVELQLPFYDRPLDFSFTNKTLQVAAELFCNRTILMGTLHSHCKSLGLGVSTFYFRSCLQRIATSESLYMSMEVIIAYADYCQACNNLTVWPAKHLCNEFPGREFPIWFGERCERKCIFGKKLASETCVCYHGYWGLECSNTCPGGAANPCNNNGMCNVITGECECNVNYNGTQDCGKCSPGWHGFDCSLALVSLNLNRHISIGMSSTGGHYVSFDGYSFTLVSLGQFYLMNLPDLSFQIQVRHVPCRQQTVCVNAIGIRITSTVVSFHAPYTTGGAPVIWVNGKLLLLSGLISTLGSPHLGILLKYNGRNYYQIIWKDNFAMAIRIHGRYLSFKVDVTSAYCYNSTGLLGSCDNEPDNDLKVSSNGSIIPANVTQPVLNTEIGSHAIVYDKDSLIVLKYEHYHETRLPTGGMYALLFNKTGASSKPLIKTFNLNVDITLEILLKPYQFSGTIFSYAVLQTFAVLIESSLRIHFGKAIIDTGVNVTINQWSHVSLVWYHKSRVLEFYHFNFKGKVQRRSYVLPSNPFLPGGILSLGQWELSPGDSETHTVASFVGTIDEIRVWKRAFNPAFILQNWRMNVVPTHPDLTGLWKMNEGESDVIMNLVTDEHIYLPRSPWQQPHWVFSDADINTNLTSSDKPFEMHFLNKTLEKMAKAFCFELFYKSTLHDQCHGQLKSELEFHYLVCLIDIATTDDISAALTVIVTFADHCQAVLNYSTWPAQPLCNKFPGSHFPLWIGDRCDIKCVFGAADPDDRNLCICMEGYWGSDCSQICPGGLLNICGGHGWCDSSTGQCQCQVNWRGNENCSSCSPGWNGTDCQFAVELVTSITSQTVLVAAIGGNGYFTTFFGVSFTYRVVGEFYLLRSASQNFVIQLRQAPCPIDGSYIPLCTTGFSFSLNNNVIAIRAPVATFSRTFPIFPLIWLNGNLVQVDHRTQLSVDFVMLRISTVAFEIYGPNGVKFGLTVGHSLSVTIHLPAIYCRNSTGLLGACTGVSFNNSNSLESYITSLKRNSVVDKSQTLFIYKYLHYSEYRSPSGAGFNLFFRDHSVRSGPLQLPPVDVLTIELLIKTHQTGGIIFSYLSQNIFAVIDNTTLEIIYNGSVFDTGLKLEIKQWNQLTIVLKQLVGTLYFYHVSSSGAVKVRVFKLDGNVFSNGGVLALGQWQPSPSSDSMLPQSSFVGEIDEFRIWKRRTNSDLVKSNWRLNVQAGIYPDLLHLWKFNQANGRVIPDILGKNDLFLTKFHEPQWTFSDADIPRLNPEETTFVNLSLQRDAESFCFSLILSGPLYANCEDLSIQVAQFYYKVCLHDISLSSKLRSAVYAVVTFADYCQNTLNLSEWPGKELCHHFVDQRFPYWIGSRCNTRCVFGYPRPDINSTDGVSCKCEQNYWGVDCANLCPGGLRETCNGHGVCSVTNGTCECEPHWKGNISAEYNAPIDENNSVSPIPCSRCTPGWTGADCAIAEDSSILDNSSIPRIAINFGDPHFTSVTGVNFHFEAPGAYHLFNSSIVDAQVLIVPCNNRVSCRRISEVSLRTSKTELSVRYNDFETVVSSLFDKTSNTSKELSKSDEWVEDADIRYRWLTDNILEVRIQDEIQFNILSYYGTIGTAIEVLKQRDQTDGICGEKESSWIRQQGNQSLTSENQIADTSNNDTTDQQGLTQATIQKRLITRFRIMEKDNSLTTKYASRSYSGAGYMLEFSSGNTAVMYASNTSLPVLDEFTIEIWVCLTNVGESVARFCSSDQRNHTEPVTGSHAVFSVVTAIGDFAIVCNDGLQVKWDKEKFITDINLYEGVWTHLAVTWRTIDGRMQAFVYSNGKHRQSTTYGIKNGKQFSFNGLFILGRYMRGYMVDSEYDMLGALDELKVWQYAKTMEQIRASMSVKFEDYREGLVLNVPFDEGMGQTTVGHLYSPISVEVALSLFEALVVNVTNIHLFIHSGDYPGWAPSGVHLSPLANYSLAFLNKTLEGKALEKCYESFYEGKLQEHCSPKLVSQALFYYESCLADIADSGSLAHSKLSVSLFGFYCQKVLGIKECLLHGTYDAFLRCPGDDEKQTKFTPLEIIVTTVSSLLFLLFLLIILILVCRRRKRRKSEVEQIYLHEAGGERSHKYVAEDEGDHPQAYSMRQMLDEYDFEPDMDDSPHDTPSVVRKPLVRNPAGGVLPEGEEESAV